MRGGKIIGNLKQKVLLKTRKNKDLKIKYIHKLMNKSTKCLKSAVINE